jgi:hypothetical protein
MTLGWFAISGRGASTTFDVGSGAFAAGCWAGVADGELVPVEGATVRRAKFSWPWIGNVPKRRKAPKEILRNDIN